MAFEQEEARRNQVNADREFNYRQEQDRIANSLAMARGSSGGRAGSYSSRGSRGLIGSISTNSAKAKTNYVGNSIKDKKQPMDFKYNAYLKAREKYEAKLDLLKAGGVDSNRDKIATVENNLAEQLTHMGISPYEEMIFIARREQEKLNRQGRSVRY